jgi:hypothetical protein
LGAVRARANEADASIGKPQYQQAYGLARQQHAALTGFESASGTVGPLTVTVSIGVRSSDDTSFDLSTLLETADQAL